MTDILKHIADFLQNDATLGNISAFLFMICTVAGSWFNKLLKKKNELLQAKILKQEKDIKEGMDKLGEAMLTLSNMYEVAFANSKLDVKTKLYLQERHNDIFKALKGFGNKVVKEEVEIVPEVVVEKELKEEKSVLDQIKEEL